MSINIVSLPVVLRRSLHAATMAVSLLVGQVASAGHVEWELDQTRSPADFSGWAVDPAYPLVPQSPNSMKADADMEIHTDVVGGLAAGGTIQFIDPSTVDVDGFSRNIRLVPRSTAPANPYSGGTFSSQVNLGGFFTGYLSSNSNVYSFWRMFMTSSPLTLSTGVAPDSLDFVGTGSMTIWEVSAAWRLGVSGAINSTDLNGLIATFPIVGTIENVSTTPRLILPYSATWTSSATIGGITAPGSFTIAGNLEAITSPVPEPSTLILSLGAFAGLGFITMRTKFRQI